MKHRRTALVMLAIVVTVLSMPIQAAVPCAAVATGQASELGAFTFGPTDWTDAGYIEAGTTPDEQYRIYDLPSGGGRFHVGFDAGGTTNFVQYSQLDGWVRYSEMESFIIGFLPVDVTPLERYSGIMVDSSEERFVAQLYYSDALFTGGSSDSGIILVMYAGPNTESIARVSASIGGGA